MFYMYCVLDLQNVRNVIESPQAKESKPSRAKTAKQMVYGVLQQRRGNLPPALAYNGFTNGSTAGEGTLRVGAGIVLCVVCTFVYCVCCVTTRAEKERIET